jgi:ABC-2 type transport system ATP-binding protein
MANQAILCEDLTKRYAGPPPGPLGARAGGAPGGNGRSPGGGPPAGGVLAVDRLNLAVEAGEFFGLLGPNGAGKTTTIGMLTTRVVPSGGRAVVAGVDVVAQPALARTRLAAVTQTNTLDRGLSVYDNLYFHGRYFGLSRAECRRRATDLLAHFDLAAKARSRIDQLSGGLAQRVLIARALLHRPEVLFLDEPTSGLDPQSRLRLWQELTALNRSGQTIVLTTHYMEEAEQLCRRIAIIDHGRLLALNTPQGLKDEVHVERLLKLTLGAHGAIGANTDCDGDRVTAALAKVPGVVAADCQGHTVRVQAHATPGLVGAVVAAVSQAGAELRDLSVSEPSLEAVFLKLTGKEYRP